MGVVAVLDQPSWTRECSRSRVSFLLKGVDTFGLFEAEEKSRQKENALQFILCEMGLTGEAIDFTVC
jgi:hypothetical protein